MAVGHDLIVIGASAGGVEALSELVRYLPADLPAAILIVIHIPVHGKSVMPMILNRAGALLAVHPQDGQPIQPGQIYVAPTNHHLLVKHNTIHLPLGPKENGHRPAIDPLFRTAARYYGPRVVGVILSGTLDDGTAGLLAVKQQGGVALVQDPQEALYGAMPRSAIANIAVDHVLTLSGIAARLVQLAQEPVKASPQPVPDLMEVEAGMAELDIDALQRNERPGQPSGFASPDCGGALWELKDSQVIRFRCRVGHAYSTESLLAQQEEALDVALWSGLRALEEQADLAHRMAQRSRRHRQAISAERFAAKAQEAKDNAALIRQLLLSQQVHAVDDPSATIGVPQPDL